MKPLSAKQIQTNIGNKSFIRGDNYFRRGQVVSVNLEDQSDDYVDLIGKVSGSGNNIYNQEITYYWEGDYCYIEGDCDCPVGYNCKHVAAACLQYEQDNRPPPLPDNQCLSWIDDFDVEGNVNQSVAKEEFLAYLLRPAPNKPGVLETQVLVTSTLKKGGLGKGRKVNLDNINNTTFAPDYVEAIDVDISNLLDANNRFHWSGLLLQGNLGYHTLTKILSTNRCYWLDTQSPLKPSNQGRVLSTQWQFEDNGNARLALQFEPQGQLILTDPPMYLDTEQQVIGPLTNNALSIKQLTHLIDSPIIPAELVNEFSQKLVEKIPGTLLPPPKSVDIEEISGVLPTPHLLLTTLAVDDQQFHSMQLQFNYSGHQLNYAPNEKYYQRKHNNKLTRIQRDQIAESDAAQQLKTVGFTAIHDPQTNEFHFLSYSTNSLNEDITRFYHFTKEVIPRLQRQGWEIEYDKNFSLVFHETEQWHAEIKEESDHNDWFELHFDIKINGKPVALFPLIVTVINNYQLEHLPEVLHLPFADNEYIAIESAQLKPVLETLYELYDTKNVQQNNSLRLSRFDAVRMSELETLSSGNTQWRGGKALRKLGQQLKNFQGIATVKAPSELKANLRDYQQTGLNWLQFLKQHQFGGILADDMGLGKTIQALAHIQYEKEQGFMKKPVLIIAPTSLMGNWHREAQQFSPSLKVLVLQGPNRHQLFQQIDEHDLVLSTYPLLHRDQEKLLDHDYHILILDEAQIVKNPKVKAAKVIRMIKTEQRLCLTGTPMENHLGELWSLFDFLMPGFLGDSREFGNVFRTPIEKHGNDERRRQLVKRITPFMLRRTKAEVAKELPEKNEIIQTVTLQSKQAALYESIRISMEQKVRQAIAEKGLARSHITILDALLKLRQACCDPRLLSLSQAKNVKESAKLEWLIQVLPEMVEEGRRILLFSQFTTMLSLIETELEKHAISYTKLTGKTLKRDKVIDQFKSGKASVFLISLKAGGVGLNLTEADTVIHYDPWWNPATENQATDRAHRIGQNKSVFVYKLITENSVEEKIVAMQKNKQSLAEGIYDNNLDKAGSQLTADDLQQLFTPL